MKFIRPVLGLVRTLFNASYQTLLIRLILRKNLPSYVLSPLQEFWPIFLFLFSVFSLSLSLFFFSFLLFVVFGTLDLPILTTNHTIPGIDPPRIVSSRSLASMRYVLMQAEYFQDSRGFPRLDAPEIRLMVFSKSHGFRIPFAMALQSIVDERDFLFRECSRGVSIKAYLVRETFPAHDSVTRPKYSFSITVATLLHRSTMLLFFYCFSF